MNAIRRACPLSIASVAIFATNSSLATVPSTAPADAQAPSASASGAAEALFAEGRHLVAEGHYAQGCAKLEQSQKLDPAAGTLVNLADCYEKRGKLAAAWIGFHEAAVVAQRSGRSEWAEQARERARLLEPRVPMLTITVDEPAPGLEVRRDGALVEPSTLGSPVPVDPDTYDIGATAPGRQRWLARVAVTAGTRVVLHVPPLAQEEAPTSHFDDMARPLAGPPERSRGTVQRTIAFALGAAAIASIGAGAYLGVTAIKGNNDAASRCPLSPRCTDPQAIALTDDALRAADASTAMFVTAGVLLATGVGLFFTAPKDQPHQLIGLHMGASSLSVLGAW